MCWRVCGVWLRADCELWEGGGGGGFWVGWGGVACFFFWLFVALCAWFLFVAGSPFVRFSFFVHRTD